MLSLHRVSRVQPPPLPRRASTACWRASRAQTCAARSYRPSLSAARYFALQPRHTDPWLTYQNLVGVPLMFNAVYFFSLIGLKNTFTANLIIYCVLLAGVLVSFYLVDKVGRRPLLLGGTATMSVLVFIVGGIGFMTLTDAAGNALVAIMSIWVAAYSVSIAPIGKSRSASSSRGAH